MNSIDPQQSSDSTPLCYHLSRDYFDLDGMSIPIFDCVVNTVTSITAILGNLLVVVSLWRSPSLHVPSNVLLMGLALSDLGVGVAVQPLFVAYNISKINRHLDVFCNSAMLSYIISFALIGVSILTATAVSVDRYLALYLHMRYHEIVTKERVIAVLTCIWISCIMVGASWLWSKTVNDLAGVFIISPCVSFTFFIYYKIYRIVRRHQMQIRTLEIVRSENGNKSLNVSQIKKSTITMFMVFCLLLLFYLPFLCTSVSIIFFGITVYRQTVAELTITILCVNSTLNPLVYCWRLTEIRTAVKKTLADFVSDVRESTAWITA